MSHIDYVYNNLAKAVLHDGFSYTDKSRDIEMLEIPHYLLDIDMTKGFPILTTKKIFFNGIVHELLWMLSGETNIDYLRENGVKYWDKDAERFSGGNYVGRIYGAQWREWIGGEQQQRRDQILDLMVNARNNLNSRRLLVTAWNPSEIGCNDVALPPCHWAFQLLPTKNGFALKWFQRSCDVFLGIPFDIVLYGLLGKLIEKYLGLKFERLIGDLSCVHFYKPHIPAVQVQLERSAIHNEAAVNIKESITDLRCISFDDIELENYVSFGPIKAEMYTKIKGNENK